MDIEQKVPEPFFVKSAPCLQLLYLLKRALERSIPDVHMKVQNSQIVFSDKKNFAYVWIPMQKTSERPESYIILSFILDSRLHSSRIKKISQPRPNRYNHHILLSKTEDIDEELIQWLKLAHKVSIQ